MSSRPYIHCFMLTSIDGKVTGNFLINPECKPYVSKFIETDKNFNYQGFIYGKNTSSIIIWKSPLGETLVNCVC